MIDDRPAAIVVLAKQPLPGRVKTRLQSRFSPVEAAELAAAALTDTLRTVRASGVGHRLLAWDGDPTGWAEGFDVVQQPKGDLNARLTAAFAAALTVVPNGPVLLIGMDTPQLTPELLRSPWRGADAVLGLSEDGGFWAIGLRSTDPVEVFERIPMSTDRTGAAQLGRLAALGLSVELLAPLRDIDRPEDAEQVAGDHPELLFSRRHADLVAGHREQPVDVLFDELYAGRPVTGRPTAERQIGDFTGDRDRWLGSADPVDGMVVSRCEPPVIDIGCGPGRMVTALQQSGRPVLGIDISRTAVGIGASRGGQVLRRRLGDPLPGEGRWGTALLLDGNIGIGGDVSGLLVRCRDLVGPGGLIICEVQGDLDAVERYEIVLCGDGHRSEPIAWASVGFRALQGLAAQLDLVVVEEWRADNRAFVSLRTGS